MVVDDLIPQPEGAFACHTSDSIETLENALVNLEEHGESIRSQMTELTKICRSCHTLSSMDIPADDLTDVTYSSDNEFRHTTQSLPLTVIARRHPTIAIGEARFEAEDMGQMSTSIEPCIFAIFLDSTLTGIF